MEQKSGLHIPDDNGTNQNNGTNATHSEPFILTPEGRESPPWTLHASAILPGNEQYKDALFAMEALGHVLLSVMKKAPKTLNSIEQDPFDSGEGIGAIYIFHHEAAKNAAIKYGVTNALELSDKERKTISSDRVNFITNPDDYTKADGFTVERLAASALAPTLAVLKSFINNSTIEQRVTLAESLEHLICTTHVPDIYKDAGLELCAEIKHGSAHNSHLLNTAESFVTEHWAKSTPEGFDLNTQLEGIVSENQRRILAEQQRENSFTNIDPEAIILLLGNAKSQWEALETAAQKTQIKPLNTQ